ncbi:hypothetical protein SAMN05216246_11321 [Actinomyces denticolens]|uniref:Uncharacterized protein n=1 Tax=Actinomyces denticolens TaxID=52767 RepID=A0ABY1IH49_9ACTO|nr:hypothetical protein [Actinomyces denticolens]SHJ16209.1 hypothetical protein SAMN05216246_11321 [Actinomyces denticolens]
MEIAVRPDTMDWIVIPTYPAPGWARIEARRRAAGALDPSAEPFLLQVLEGLSRADRLGSEARVVRCRAGRPEFVVDLAIVPATDDSSKAGRHSAQKAVLGALIPDAEPQRLRPAPDMAGFWAMSSDAHAHPQAAIILRMAGLPTIPADLIMRVWGSIPEQLHQAVDEAISLAGRVVPAEA